MGLGIEKMFSIAYNYAYLTNLRIFKVLRTSGFIKEIRTNSLSIRKLNG